jgi:hypothetical protein
MAVQVGDGATFIDLNVFVTSVLHFVQVQSYETYKTKQCLPGATFDYPLLLNVVI